MAQVFEEKISIIIPVYNVFEYLEKCVDSVLSQSYGNIEILIIDDGSTDGSSDLCDTYAKKDKRIKVFHQKNKGVVAARNLGVENATGKYIGFVDADDWIEPDMYETMVSEIKESDIISTGYKKYYFDNEGEIEYFDAIPEGTYKGRQEMEFVWSNMIYWKDTEKKGIYSFLWCKLFRKNIIKSFYENLRQDIRYSEDAVFLYNYLLRANSITILNKSFYHHRIRQGSAVYSYDKYFLSNVNNFYVSVEEIFSSHYLKEKLIPQLENKVIQLLNEGLKYKMGFSRGLNFKYKLPYEKELENKKIILYGAGRVGTEYYEQIRKIHSCEVMHWVDKGYKTIENHGKKIEGIDVIKTSVFEFILIAIEKEEIAMSIITELENLGVKKEKILWRKPLLEI